MIRGKRPRHQANKKSREADLHEEKRGGRRTLAVPVAVALSFALVIAALFVASLATGGPSSGGKTAVIVDQLSLTAPNPSFVQSAKQTLEDTGYEVEYFPGEEVTVDFYRDLPRRGYDVILLRVHAGIIYETDRATGERTVTEQVTLFTGEPYSKTKHVEEQIGPRLFRTVYYEGASPLFGIGPLFVEDSMRGRFDGTDIIMMGCDGLRSRHIAEAFLDRGADTFISWSRSVSADHTDAAIERLLEHLLVDRLDAEEAVTRTAAEIGPDPSYGAELRILMGEG